MAIVKQRKVSVGSVGKRKRKPIVFFPTYTNPRSRQKASALLIKEQVRGKLRLKFQVPRSSILFNYGKFARIRKFSHLSRHYQSRHFNLNSVLYRYLFDREVINNAKLFSKESKLLSEFEEEQENQHYQLYKPSHWRNFSYDDEIDSYVSKLQSRKGWPFFDKPNNDSFNFDDDEAEANKPDWVIEAELKAENERLMEFLFNYKDEDHESLELFDDTREQDEAEKEEEEERKAKAKKSLSFDRFDYLTSAFVSIICRRGLKLKAERILEDTLRNLGELIKGRFKRFQSVTTFVLRFTIRYFFLYAIENVKPLLSLKKQLVAGVVRSSPIVTSEQKRLLVAIRWIVAAAKARSEIPFSKALSAELFDAFFSKGRAVVKRSELHSVVISSRAFLRFKKEKGKEFSKETFTMSGFRTSLRSLLRRRLSNRFREILAKIRAPKAVLESVNSGNQTSWKRVSFVKRSREEITQDLHKFFMKFNAMSFSEKISFLLGSNRFIYVYKTKFMSRWSGFHTESLMSFSSPYRVKPLTNFEFRKHLKDSDSNSSIPLSEKLPVFVTTVSSEATAPRFRRPPYSRPETDRIVFDSLINRCWLRPRYVLSMYRRERRPGQFFKSPKSKGKYFNYRKKGFNSGFKKTKGNAKPIFKKARFFKGKGREPFFKKTKGSFGKKF